MSKVERGSKHNNISYYGKGWTTLVVCGWTECKSIQSLLNRGGLVLDWISRRDALNSTLL